VTYGNRLRELRAERRLSLRQVEERGGPNKDTLSLIERGVHKPHAQTLGRIAAAFDMTVAELRRELEAGERPLDEASPSQQLTLNGELEEERRAVWEAAAEEARRLRKDGRAQMDDLLVAWRESRERGEPKAARRGYMDEMGNLLKEVYDADVAVGWAYLEAALTQGGSTANVPRYLQEESRTTSHFYGELLGLVKSAGLSVLTGDDAAAARRAAKVQPGRRPYSVEEHEAA
jgi:transcriptional regulator with XRE-family HTH domain